MKNTINILFIGDIIGTPGMEMTSKILKTFQDQYKIDFTIANGENVTDGKGLSEQDANQLFSLGVNVLTGGNHLWDRPQAKALLGKEKRILRPMNYPKDNAGYGYVIEETKDKVKIAVANLQGKVFMFPIDCPFRSADWILGKVQEETKIIIVDFHAEATAEKMALGWYLDGRVSAVIGTHTHIQTSDSRILPKGTAYISDVGMTGPYESAIGMKKDIAIKRFMYQTPFKYESATDDVHFCGAVISVDIQTGKAIKIQRINFPEFIQEVQL
jgi:2',3'-cyclic-nucleotide 2'-phosphodiesterase